MKDKKANKFENDTFNLNSKQHTREEHTSVNKIIYFDISETFIVISYDLVCT